MLSFSSKGLLHPLSKVFYTFLATLFLTSYGVVLPTPVAQAAAPVVVDVAQQPLTLQPKIPPDVVLMLDDSGSMAWDYMPDACYLDGVICRGTNNGTNPANGNGTDYITSYDNDALIDAANNGVYYDPTTTYTPPPTATAGNFYPAGGTLTSAMLDGFNPGEGNVNIATYSNNDLTGEKDSQNDRLDYSTQVVGTDSNNYSQYAYNSWSCRNTYYNYPGAFGGYQYSYSSNTCSFTYHSVLNYFQYATGPAGGPYVVHYVAPASQGCGTYNATTTPSCVTESDTGGTAAPAGVAAGTNIANWFAYDHTRIQMAKSGLMSAFSGLDPRFRVGFGSIDSNNYGSLPNTYNVYSTDIARVAPFGDGSSGTQKAAFWNWIAGERANGGTPLRIALSAVGKYYQSEQPWSTMSTDPAGSSGDIACRQAYTILSTDGFWNGNYGGGVGNSDGKAGPVIKGLNGQRGQYTPVAPYSDSYSDTLADVANYYWDHDLRSTLNNEVPISSDDPAFWQHMDTFTVGLGFQPVGLSPAGTTVSQVFNWANGGPALSGFSWPEPASNSIYNITDLAHAGLDGHGNFYSVTNPTEFQEGFTDALKRVSSRVGSGSSLAADSTQLNTGTVIYQANYYTSIWKGDLKALPVDPTTGVIGTTPNWTASGSLATQATVSGSISTYPSRDIETYNSATQQFVPFAVGAGNVLPDLSPSELTALGSSSSVQADMIDYLRGDNTHEAENGGSYRSRTTPLGDIINSQPVFSGVPTPDEFTNQNFLGTTIPAGDATSPFYQWAVGTASGGAITPSAASQRVPLVFVAANDGMLHAFNASTGKEVFAYLPGAVLTAGLTDLSDPNYGSDADPHQYFNDGQLTIADAYLPQLPAVFGSNWHTILVGTTGAGEAEAIYALDITDPTHITPLWERSASDGLPNSQYIGQMVGKPVIAQTSYTPGAAPGTGVSSWSVLMGNGYNSAEGQAALLQFDLATGTLSVHTVADTSQGNGLAAPIIWEDNLSDGVGDVAYAGDNHGQVWSFSLNDNTGQNPTPTSTGNLLFTADDSSGHPEPITAGMLAGQDPSTGNLWLFFGTGRYLGDTDLTDTQTQTWYGIIVKSSTASLVSHLSQGRSALVQRTILTQTLGSEGVLPTRTISTATSGDMTGKSGWYLDLEAPNSNGTPQQQGERMVDSNEFQGNLLLGVSLVPVVNDICNPSGSGWIMAIQPFTGAAPPASFFDVNGDGSINSGDDSGGVPAAGVGFSSLPNMPIFVGGAMETSFENGSTSSIMTSGTTGNPARVSWREMAE